MAYNKPRKEPGFIVLAHSDEAILMRPEYPTKDMPEAARARMDSLNIVGLHYFDSYDDMVREASIMVASGFPTITVFAHGRDYIRAYLKGPRSYHYGHDDSVVEHDYLAGLSLDSTAKVQQAVAGAVLKASDTLIQRVPRR